VPKRFGINLYPPLSPGELKFLDALKEARSNDAANVSIAPGLPNTVPRRVETPNKSLDLYSLKDMGLKASRLH
jgi:hypothetical protein